MRIRYESQTAIRAALEELRVVISKEPQNAFIYQVLCLIGWAEGLVLTTYRCTAGALTIGWGHNLDALPVKGLKEGSVIDVDQANDLLLQGFMRATKGAIQLAPEMVDKDWYGATPQEQEATLARVAILIDMCFNMGITRLSKFKKFLAAFRAKDWQKAADEMVDSAWYKQVGRRSVHHVAQMRKGEWVDTDLVKGGSM